MTLNNSLHNVTYAVCYLHIKQIAISQERRAIWKNYRWNSSTISRVLTNKTNLIFISYTGVHFNAPTAAGVLALIFPSEFKHTKTKTRLSTMAEQKIVSPEEFLPTLQLPQYSMNE